MPPLINFKVCDNSADCNGIKVCPVGAFLWDDKKETIYVEEDKCINCGLCEKSCEVDAIKVCQDAQECAAIKKQFEDDPRSVADLMADRFGAMPVLDSYRSNKKDIKTVLKSPRPYMVELYTDDTIMCLVKSIPIEELLPAFDAKATYRKINDEDGELSKEYGVKELPALLFFRHQKLVGKIEGYHSLDEVEKLKKEIAKIAKNAVPAD